MGHSQSQTDLGVYLVVLRQSRGCERSVSSPSLLHRPCSVGLSYVTGLNKYQFVAIEDKSSVSFVSGLGPGTAYIT